ncbi:CcdB family protein [Ectothiorhodospira haloalkaliphila]|uniref:CcdB family protein n=1 Tax=Ectothiorhodospira haloalkaliphila TaxID=421628 RepID=UPI000A02C44E
MAPFDVYPNPSKVSQAHYPYLVDAQSSLLSDLATRIVIPLGKSSLASRTLLAFGFTFGLNTRAS